MVQATFRSGRSGWRQPRLLLCAVLACLPSLAGAQCNLTAAGQGRWYPDDGALTHTYDMLGSVTGEVSCSHRVDAHALSTKLFGRVAQHDSSRSHFDVRELLWTMTHDRIVVRAGIDQVFWGVTEFARVVDTVNQADVLEDPFGDVKLGQPLLNVALRERWGTLNAYAMPRFRPRRYPDFGEPLRTAPPLRIDRQLYESDHGRGQWEWALRYALNRGPLDVGVTYFDGTARDPVFIDPHLTARGPAIAAYYPLMEQLGVDLQLTFGEWLFKFEGARREQLGRTRQAYAVGLEYAFIGFAGTPADVTIAAEYVRDERQPPPVPGFLDRDWALGVRLALNDARSTEGRFGLIADRVHDSQAWAVELSTRIANDWRVAGEARWFHRVTRSDPLRVIHSDGYIDVSLTRYF